MVGFLGNLLEVNISSIFSCFCESEGFGGSSLFWGGQGGFK